MEYESSWRIWVLAIVVILVLFICYWLWAQPASIDGYWTGTREFNEGLGVKFSIVYIKGSMFVWVLENDAGQVAAQAYKIKDKDGHKVMTMITGEGESVFNGPVSIEVREDAIEIKGSVGEIVMGGKVGNNVLFHGIRKEVGK